MSDYKNHHFVPKWHQKNFLAPGETKLHRLNLIPRRRERGRTIPMRPVERKGIDECFARKYLYSVDLPGIDRQVYEKLFFGRHDTIGARAVRAFASAASEEAVSPDVHRQFFEYLSVQSYRTPKGLDLLKRQHKIFQNNELMATISALQSTKCAMWMEGFQEILTTTSDEVGFVITDHPVTSYNAACPAVDPTCRYPRDPEPGWIGTQTIFPISPRQCLVLTHSELVTGGAANRSARAPRTNSRLFGNTIARTDCVIHREVSDVEVAKINYIFKLRATQFLAATFEDWLFPERCLGDPTWAELGEPLMPREKLWRGRGQIFLRYKNGDVVSMDSFGRHVYRPDEQHLAREHVSLLHQELLDALRGSGHKKD